MSPTQRSLKHLKAQGYTCQIVEKWNPWAKIRQDLFGIVDIYCLKAGMPPVGVQTTSGSNHSARVEKALKNENLALWKASGNRFVVQSWAKRGARGQRKVWELREQEL
jgi:hypothetical protein